MRVEIRLEPFAHFTAETEIAGAIAAVPKRDVFERVPVIVVAAWLCQIR